MYEFKKAIDAIFSADFALGQQGAASNVRGELPEYDASRAVDHNRDTFWATDDTVRSGILEIDLGEAHTFNVARIQEPIALGQRVQVYRVEVWKENAWQTVCTGTTIGHQKLDRFETVTTDRVRLVIEEARACPLIAGFGLHYDPRG